MLFPGHGHSHDGDHGHSHGGGGNSQIMKGVFLHILADTLGSVGVIISAILMHLYGWMIADPICSICIAFLIVISVWGLVKESAVVLMQRQPRELDGKLPECYNKVGVTTSANLNSLNKPECGRDCHIFNHRWARGSGPEKPSVEHLAHLLLYFTNSVQAVGYWK